MQGACQLVHKKVVVGESEQSLSYIPCRALTSSALQGLETKLIALYRVEYT